MFRALLKVGYHTPCQSTPTKRSKYCALHNRLVKNSKVVPCINCGRGTYAKYRVCTDYGAENVWMKHWLIYLIECRGLRRIDIN